MKKDIPNKKERKPRGIRKPRGYVPGDFVNNLHIARCEYINGNDPVSPEALRLFSDCISYSELTAANPNPYHKFIIEGGLNKKHIEMLLRSIGLAVCDEIKSGNGSLLNDLARLKKFQGARPNITLNSWLLHLHRSFLKGWKSVEDPDQNCFFTAPELCKLAKMRGFPEIPVRQMHQICDRLGIAYINSRTGDRKSDYQDILNLFKRGPKTVVLRGRISRRISN